jgi:hypothetical protein
MNRKIPIIIIFLLLSAVAFFCLLIIYLIDYLINSLAMKEIHWNSMGFLSFEGKRKEL